MITWSLFKGLICIKWKSVFYPAVFLVLVLTLILSCKKNRLEQRAAWNTEILAPLLQSSLNLTNIIADTMLTTNSDQSLNLVYRTLLSSYGLTDRTLVIPDTTLITKFSLDSLKLADKTITYPLSLGQVAQQLGFIGQVLIFQNGSNAVIPAIAGISSGDNALDATQFFETATMQTGFIDMTINNGFPIPIDTLIFQLRNAVSGTNISQDTFLNILQGASATKVIDLAGQTVEGTMIAKIIKLSSPGSGSTAVLIDTTDALLATMFAHNMRVQSATAIFPSQNLVDKDQETQYSLDGGAALTKLKIKSGTLHLVVRSTIEDSTHFDFTLPDAISPTGDFIHLNSILPPAPPTGISSFSRDIDLSGYNLDLTGPLHNGYSTVYSHLIARIDSTGQQVHISLSDSVYIEYSLLNITPDYVEGYLGQHIEEIGPSEIDFSLFRHIKSGSINLEQVNLSLGIDNGIGAEGRLIFYNLNSVNTKTNIDVPLVWNNLNVPIAIPRAVSMPLTSSSTTLTLNNGNSNIGAFIQNFPDKIKYGLSVFLNPNGNTNNYQDFAYADSRVSVNLDLNVPLSFVANRLALEDTVDFSLGNQPSPGKPSIKSGTFNIIADNGYPLDAHLQLYLYDDHFNFIDSLITGSDLINSGKLNTDCRVGNKTRSVLTVQVDESKMSRLKAASKAIIHADFSTSSSTACNSYIKIYSDYSIDVKLTGKFIYNTGYLQ